jgi:hypothetical protein
MGKIGAALTSTEAVVRYHKAIEISRPEADSIMTRTASKMSERLCWYLGRTAVEKRRPVPEQAPADYLV